MYRDAYTSERSIQLLPSFQTVVKLEVASRPDIAEPRFPYETSKIREQRVSGNRHGRRERRKQRGASSLQLEPCFSTTGQYKQKTAVMLSPSWDGAGRRTSNFFLAACIPISHDNNEDCGQYLCECVRDHFVAEFLWL